MPPANPEKEDAAQEDAPNAARAGSASETAAKSPSAAAAPESPEGREGATGRGLKLHHLRPATTEALRQDVSAQQEHGP